MRLGNRVVQVLMVVWTAAITLSVWTGNPAYLLLPIVVFAINEVGYCIAGFDMLPSSDRTEMFYDISAVATLFHGTSHNYSEGYYKTEEDYQKLTPQEAEDQKFEKILELLGAKPGDTILDLGCGMGSFERFCAKRGYKMIGFTLSSEQRDFCQSVNVIAEVWDFRCFNEKYRHKIDHIVMMGSSEHIYTGPGSQWDSYTKKKTVVSDFLKDARDYFRKDDDRPHRIFYSGLHLNPCFCKSFGWHVMDRTYGATLFLNDPAMNIVATATDAGYRSVYQRDATKDYFMATVLDTKHFGNPIRLHGISSIALIIGMFIYPLLFFMWLYYILGVWMWMFDGRFHLWPKNPPFTLKKPSERPATLWWCVFEAL